MRIANDFQRLKYIQDQMEALQKLGLSNSKEYLDLYEAFRELKERMPKYRPHVWRQNGL